MASIPSRQNFRYQSRDLGPSPDAFISAYGAQSDAARGKASRALTGGNMLSAKMRDVANALLDRQDKSAAMDLAERKFANLQDYQQHQLGLAQDRADLAAQAQHRQQHAADNAQAEFDRKNAERGQATKGLAALTQMLQGNRGSANAPMPELQALLSEARAAAAQAGVDRGQANDIIANSVLGQALAGRTAAATAAAKQSQSTTVNPMTQPLAVANGALSSLEVLAKEVKTPEGMDPVMALILSKDHTTAVAKASKDLAQAETFYKMRNNGQSMFEAIQDPVLAARYAMLRGYQVKTKDVGGHPIYNVIDHDGQKYQIRPNAILKVGG